MNKYQHFLIPALLFLSATLAWLPSDFYVAGMPLIAENLDTTINHVQLTISIFLLGFALMPLLHGIISDRWGRKKALIIGMFILLVGTVVCAVSTNINTLLVGRFLQGAGAAACLALPRSILRDLYSGVTMARMNAIIGVAIELTAAVAPAIGGFVVEFLGWRSTFYINVVMVLIAISCIYYFLPETNRNLQLTGAASNNTGQLLAVIKRVITNRRFLAFTVAEGAALSIIMSFFIISPFLLQDKFLLSPKTYGLATLIVTLCIVIGISVSALIVKRVGINRCVLLGLVTVLLASAVMLVIGSMYTPSFLGFIIPSAVVMFGGAFMFANCAAGALAEFPDVAGVASAIYTSIELAVAFVVTSILSVSVHDTHLGLATAMVVTSLISLLLFFWAIYFKTKKAG